MLIRLFTLILIFGYSINIYSQVPQAFKYQAVVRDAQGKEIRNSVVSLRIGIIKGDPGGTLEYSEMHQPATNNFGLINVEIGNGNVISGNFENIEWGNDLRFVQIEVDPDGGTNYTISGTSQLLSVPYALQSENSIYSDSSGIALQSQNAIIADTVLNEADGDPFNEWQVISISNDTIHLSDGGFAVLPPPVADDADNNPENEIQQLVVSQTGDTLYLTNGNYVIIPGISASNSGTPFANAGPDMFDVCNTEVYLSGSEFPNDASVEWSIISGTGGIIDSPNSRNTLFTGLEGELYELEYKVIFANNSEAFDRKSLSIAEYTTASVADAGADQLAISTTATQLDGNTPGTGNEGRWIIQSGSAGMVSDISNPEATFTGIKGEVYELRWEHYNDCSSSSDIVVISISETAQGEVSSTGRYFIPDNNFRLYLQILYPTTMDGDSLILSNTNSIEKINISNLNINNLDGLQFLTNLKTFICFDEGGKLNEIPYFSNVLRRFECANPSLTIIPDFPESLDTIVVSQWNVASIPSFPANLKILTLSGSESITTIPTIPETCQKVRLVGFEFLTSDINIPSSASLFVAIATNLQNFPSLPINKSNLEELILENCGIDQMPSLADFINLGEFSFQANNISVLNYLPIGLNDIRGLVNNPIICAKNKPVGVADVLADYPICP